jgi:hypothetical protein
MFHNFLLGVLQKIYFWIEIKHQIKISMLWDITPSSPLKFNWHFGGNKFLRNAIEFQRTTRRCIPDDRILHNRLSENCKSYKISNAVVLLPKTCSKMKVINMHGTFFCELLSQKLFSYQTDIYGVNILGMYFIFWPCTKHISPSKRHLPRILEVSSYNLDTENCPAVPYAFWQ